MRVISGDARGRKLAGYSDLITRPTSELVKEAIMSIIQFDIVGAKVLDLFAGTGQLGIEALSRGAKTCDFVDNDSKSIKIIKENLAHTELLGGITVQSSAESFIKTSSNSYDIVFLDPPYGKEIIPNIIEDVLKLVADSGIIICEVAKEDELPDSINGFSKSKDYKYGKKKVNVYRKIKAEG